MSTIQVSPNPAAPGDYLTVTGTDFQRKPSLLFVGGKQINGTFSPNGGGDFSIGAGLAPAVGNYVVMVDQKVSGRYTPIATTPLVVADVAPPPVITPVPNERTVSSILAMKQAAAVNDVDKVTLVPNRYKISPAEQLQSDSLWIGGPRGGVDLTQRTRPVTVVTTGAILDGQDATGKFFAMMEGATLLEFVDLTFDRCNAAGDGVIKIGGDPGYAGAHHFALRRPKVLPTCKGRTDSSDLDHALYISMAQGGGPHDFEITDVDLDCGGNLDCGLHGYHSQADAYNAHDVKITGTIRNGRRAIQLWDPTIRNWSVNLAVISSRLNDLNYWGDLHQSEQAPVGVSASGINITIAVSGTHPSGYGSLALQDRVGLTLAVQ